MMVNTGNQIVQPVDRAKKGRLAAPGRANNCRHGFPLDRKVQVFERLPGAVEEGEVLNSDGG
jgi:hypothetical protein